MPPSDPHANLERFVHNIAAEIGATEAAAFAVESDVHDARLTDVLVHIRPDDSDDEVRSAALKAFKDIMAPIVQQREDGAVEVGPDDGSGKQFGIVVLRRRDREVRRAAAFIVRCRDLDEAGTVLKRVQKTTNARILDFGSAGMWWEITRSTADTNGEYFEAINVIHAGFGGPPVHAHPHAEESYAVTDGELDVCVAGEWRKLRAGESATVPPGVAHTLKNTSGAEVRLVNVHRPAMEFERFFRRMHAMIAAGTMSLPPRGPGSLLRIAMLFREHEREIVCVKPPDAVMRVLAGMGRVMGVKLAE